MNQDLEAPPAGAIKEKSVTLGNCWTTELCKMVPAGLGTTWKPSSPHVPLPEVPAPTWTQAVGVHEACCPLSPLPGGGGGPCLYIPVGHKSKYLERRGWRGCGYLPVQSAAAPCPQQWRLTTKSSVSQVCLTFSKLGGHLLLSIRAKSPSNFCRHTIWWGRDTSASLSLSYRNAEFGLFGLFFHSVR